MNYINHLKSIIRLQKQTILDDIKNNKDKEFFKYTGTQVYIGKQGSGKTYSAVRDVKRLLDMYPKAILVTNLKLNGITNKIYDFKTVEQLSKLLVSINNGKYGVIYLIDEIHTYFNALQSKNIPMYVFTEISQQRKQRKLIIGTSQLFLRMAKPLREQADNIILCKTIFNYIGYNIVYDAWELKTDEEGKIITNSSKKYIYIHDEKTRKMFDTYQKVISGSDLYDKSI